MVLNNVTLDNIHLHLNKMSDPDNKADETMKQDAQVSGNAGEALARRHQDIV